MPEETTVERLKATIARLEAELAALPPQASHRSVVLEGSGANAIIVTGDGNRVAPHAAPPPLLYQAYLSSLENECGELPLAVIEPRFADGHAWGAVRLPDVFVEPAVHAHDRPEAADDGDAWGMRLLRGEAGEQQPATAALAADGRAHAVLLGDQGTGKTTLGHRLCQRLAAARLASAQGAPARPASDDGEKLPAALASLVPIRMVLREAAVALTAQDAKKHGRAALLWDALDQQLASCIGQAAAPALAAELRRRIGQSGAFVLLDGLDEVATTGHRRQRILEAVQDLASQLRDPSRLLVTARPYAYQDRALQLGGFHVFTLAPFDRPRVVAFIEQWYGRPARRLIGWDEKTATVRASRLIAALDARTDLGDLASRPLLLMLMATLDASRSQLPEGRADLFHEITGLLLKRWQQSREVRDAEGRLIQEPGLAAALEADEPKIRQALEALAYAAHLEQQGAEGGDGMPADIQEGAVLLAFKSLLGPLTADGLIAFLRDRAGLLIERRTGVFAFPHRAFQEFLAACHLGRQPDSATTLAQRVKEDPIWWREVALFSISRSFAADVDAGLGRVRRLVPKDVEPGAGDPDATWQTAIIASLACVDLGLRAREHEHPYGEIVARCRGWMRALVEGLALDPRSRHQAGDLLSRLGDPRPGVGTVTIKQGAREQELPDIDWVEVPAGPFQMGSAGDDELADAHEKPQHELDLPRFRIARYPVTHEQYRPFVDDGGYHDQQWWTEAGWAWRKGSNSDLEQLPRALQDLYRGSFERRPKDRRDRPFGWNHPAWGLASRPVVGVTWFEAMAYARWLAARTEGAAWGLSDAGAPRLPTEAEWEKAARGGDGRRWPWGDDFAESRCNSEEAGLGRTSAVGLFEPAGSKRPADLAGNVWEWTTSAWGEKLLEASHFGYRYDPSDGREDPALLVARVLRGGSWYDDKKYVRCAVRGRYLPDDWHFVIGFRLVFSLAEL